MAPRELPPLAPVAFYSVQVFVLSQEHLRHQIAVISTNPPCQGNALQVGRHQLVYSLNEKNSLKPRQPPVVPDGDKRPNQSTTQERGQDFQDFERHTGESSTKCPPLVPGGRAMNPSVPPISAER
jgi:hypothetical protein